MSRPTHECESIILVCDYDPRYSFHGSSVISRNILLNLPQDAIYAVYTVYSDLPFYSDSLEDCFSMVPFIAFPSLNKFRKISSFLTGVLSLLPAPCTRINKSFFATEIANPNFLKADAAKLKFIIVGPSLFPLISLIRRHFPSCYISFVPYDSLTLSYLNTIQTQGMIRYLLFIIKMIPWLIAESRFTRYADKVVYVTQDDALLAKKLSRFSNPSKINFIPNGIDTNFFSYKKPISHPTYNLMISGNLSNPPLISSIIWFIQKVFYRLCDSEIHLKLVIAGANPTKELVSICDRNESIYLYTNVPDLRNYYYDSMIFIAPHLAGSGIKNSVLQAMSSGIPIISTPLGISGLQVADNVHVLVAHNDEEFISKIHSLIDSYAARAKLSENAYDYIRNTHSWHVFAQALV